MKKRKAFTLIELLIVVAIIAILAVIIIMNLISARDKANYAKVKSDLKTVSDSIRLFYVDATSAKVSTATQTVWAPLTADVLKKFTDDKDNQLISAMPVPPSTWSGSTYNYFTASASSYGVRILDPINNGSGYCGYINGNLFSGPNSIASTIGSVTYTSCTP